MDKEVSMSKKHLVCFSGGHSSALVAIEVVRKYGKENVVLLNHDISPEVEHEDIKRFKKEVAEYLGLEITYANMPGWETKTPLRVTKELKGFQFKPGQALCTYNLKTKPFYKWLEENCTDKENWTVYYGFDAEEDHRISRRRMLMRSSGYKTEFPLAEWERTIYSTEEIGIEPPRTYKIFKHANCFSGDTRFITNEGIKTLKECKGEKVKVITRDGWKEAEILCFGEQELYKIVMTNGIRKKEVYATGEHRWIIPKYNHKSFGYKEVITKELKENMIIPTVYSIPDIKPSIEGIRNGFVFGDGDLYNQKWNAKSRVYIANGKEEILEYFDGYKMTEGRKIHGLPEEYKSIPKTHDVGYLLGFVIGLVASDGNVSKSGITITHKNHEEAEKITEILNMIGICAWNDGGKTRNTNYKNETQLTKITIPKKSFKKEWLIRSFHKERYGENFTEPKSWKVVSVEKTKRKEKVYCAVVKDPIYKEFALEGNALTGNCIGCLKAGKQHWYVVYCLRPDIFQEAMKTEEEIGYSIIKGVFLKDLIPKFEETKAKGICPNDKENSSSFWARVEKTLPEQMSFMPCDCSFL